MVAGMSGVPRCSVAALHEHLREEILARRLPSGARLATDAELVEQTGLSRAAVRHVYDRLGEEGLIVRVRPNGTFVRSHMPVQRRTKGKNLLFLLGMQPRDPRMRKESFWPGRALEGVERAASEYEDSWVYAKENEGSTERGLIPESIDMDKVDGVMSYVLGSGFERQNLAHFLETLGVVHVALNDHFVKHGSNCVVEDCESGMEALVKKIADFGHYDTIFCMREVTFTVYGARHEAYRKAAFNAGLPLYPPIVLSQTFAGRWSDGAEAVGRQILAIPRRPTAVVCASDFLALNLMEFLKSKRVCIPKDMSVTGYDGYPQGETSDPPLTTVKEDWDMMGKEAVHCLHRMIADKKYRGVKVKVPIKPVFRGSLGPAPSGRT